ncbi:jouberin-like isoform X2 [Uloborus diversus]|uniref:jouberin-like isoform X2 n=1 Tax=Uloborus diversus TaxID=327109 RepID=UPI00240995C4|nr:jouberin-like isoform X2 [Uloborus diversus]
MTDEGRQKTFSGDSITKVTVHHCDKLKSEILLRQPVVCMHVVDAENGSYIKKSQRDRSVMSFYENQRSDLDYIMPVMTQPCSIQGERYHYLNWEESFILNEKFDHIFKKDMNTILFFEVIDLMSQPYIGNGSSFVGMKKIAWAFLKIFGQNDALNIGSKLRLQLFKIYPSQKNAKVSKIEVYSWWRESHRVPLQASLCVTIEAYHTFVVNPALRSMVPLQQETCMSSSEQSANVMNNPISLSPAEQKSANDTIVKDQNFEPSWSRKVGETCKVPNQLNISIETIGTCLVLKFSSSGRLLLAACGSQEQYYLLLSEIPSGKILQKEFAHCQVIYDIDWSSDDTYILSASSDYSVKIWNVKPWNLFSSLVHPSFVYSAKFHPSSTSILATACYDHIIRIWKISKNTQKVFELEGHEGSVCALDWQKLGNVICSADSVGQIKVWRTSTLQKKDDCSNYVLEKEINLQLKGSSINKIVSEKENIFCLFCNDSVKILDISSESIIFSVTPDIVTRNSCRGCCSPCGSLLFISHEDGHISVWNKITSEKICVMSNAMILGRLSSIDYHPFYHMLAVGSWEENMPIHLYIHDQTNSSDGNDTKMNEITDTHNVSSTSYLTSETVDLNNCTVLKNLNSLSSWHKKSLNIKKEI